MRYEMRTRLASIDATPPLHYKNTIDIDNIACVMMKSLSHSVTETDSNMIEDPTVIHGTVFFLQ